MISNDAILSPSSLKKNRRSTGLPGKFPTRWQVTTVFPSFSSHFKGSHVYSYFAEASVFHSLIAARPLWVWPSSFTTAFPVKHRETASPSDLSAVKYAVMGFGKFGDLVACFIFVSFLVVYFFCSLKPLELSH